MKKPPTTTPLPKPKAAAKGKAISADDDFGEATFARALKTVKEAIAEASPDAEHTVKETIAEPTPAKPAKTKKR
jgi:hypothetical protein